MHESQSFDYCRPLVPGAAYRLTAVARRESAPERLTVVADVVQMAGAPVVTMRAVLRLAPLSGGQGG